MESINQVERIAGGFTVPQPQAYTSESGIQQTTSPQEAIKPVYPEEKLSKEAAQKSVEVFNNLMKTSNSHLKFELHEKLNEYYVKIVDDTTHETIKEIPSKKLLDMVAKIYEQLGLIVDKKI